MSGGSLSMLLGIYRRNPTSLATFGIAPEAFFVELFRLGFESITSIDAQRLSPAGTELTSSCVETAPRSDPA